MIQCHRDKNVSISLNLSVTSCTIDVKFTQRIILKLELYIHKYFRWAVSIKTHLLFEENFFGQYITKRHLLNEFQLLCMFKKMICSPNRSLMFKKMTKN